MSGSRPLPVADEVSAPFWQAADAGRLVLARCARCGRLDHPPGLVCGRCGHTDPDFRFEEVDGGGTLMSWTVVRQSFLPGFEDEVPFVLADVAIDAAVGAGDDVRLIGRLVDGPDASLTIGARVVTVFDRLAPGVAVPAFELVSS